jgi:hypothetical protein
LHLIGDAQARRFDVIITDSLDRLSRSQADIAALYKRLQFLGVRIEPWACVSSPGRAYRDPRLRVWADQWTPDQIAADRRAEEERRHGYFEAIHASNNPLSRFWRWLKRRHLEANGALWCLRIQTDPRPRFPASCLTGHTFRDGTERYSIGIFVLMIGVVTPCT